jgi:hypothetical protein
MKAISKEQSKDILSALFKMKEFSLCEYIVDKDIFRVYDEDLEIRAEIPDYRKYLKTASRIHPDDRRKIVNLFYESRERGEKSIDQA